MNWQNGGQDIHDDRIGCVLAGAGHGDEIDVAQVVKVNEVVEQRWVVMPKRSLKTLSPFTQRRFARAWFYMPTLLDEWASTHLGCI